VYTRLDVRLMLDDFYAKLAAYCDHTTDSHARIERRGLAALIERRRRAAAIRIVQHPPVPRGYLHETFGETSSTTGI
jgi:hypothetical protein